MTGLTPALTAKIGRSHVLVLSGNKFTGQLVRQILFGIGMTDVALAQTLAEARERLSLSRLDLVVADTGPATYDPLEPLIALRTLADDRQAHIPVILLAAAQATLDPQFKALGLIRVPKPLSGKPIIDAVLKGLLNIEPTERPALAAPTPRDHKTTLILSANPYMIQVVRALLVTQGLPDLTVAQDAEQAEEKLAQGRVDFVVADHAPSGFDVLGLIEAKRAPGQKLADTPILLLSSDPSPTLISRARTANIQAIMAKPLDGDAFSLRVNRVLERAR